MIGEQRVDTAEPAEYKNRFLKRCMTADRSVAQTYVNIRGSVYLSLPASYFSRDHSTGSLWRQGKEKNPSLFDTGSYGPTACLSRAGNTNKGSDSKTLPPIKILVLGLRKMQHFTYSIQ